MTFTLFLKLALPLSALALITGFWFTVGKEAARYCARLATRNE